MALGKASLGVVGTIIGCCGSCCGLDPFGEEAKEAQVEQQGHEVIPVPLEIEAQRAEMEEKYQQHLKLRTEALQGECKTELDAQKCVEDYTAAHFEDEPSTEAAEKKPETDPENSSSGENEVDQDEAPEVEPTEPAEPATPGATNEPEPDTTASDRTKKPLKPISPETLFTAKQKGSYKLEDGTLLEGDFTGQGAEGTFVGKITSSKKAVLSGRATYTEKNKGGLTGWMRDPDFIYTPYGPANIVYADGSTIAFSFTDSHDGRVDYSKAAAYTVNAGNTINLISFDGATAETGRAWFESWVPGRASYESCTPQYNALYLDEQYEIQKLQGASTTAKTDCPAQ